MREYKGEYRSKNGEKSGEWIVTVDEKLNLVKNTAIGKLEAEGFQENIDCIIRELKKQRKGEPLYLVDSSSSDTKFMPPELMKITNEFSSFAEAYCKKCAGVFPSFVFRKALEIFAKGNTKYFATEREALQYLLKD